MSENTTYSIERLERVTRDADLAGLDAWVPLGGIECDWLGNAVEKFLGDEIEPQAGRYRAIDRSNVYSVCEYQVTANTKFDVTPLTASEVSA